MSKQTITWSVYQDPNKWAPSQHSGSINLRWRWLARFAMWLLRKLSRHYEAG